jgi:homocysteine S-methyltransferase
VTIDLDAWLCRHPRAVLDGGMGTELEARGMDLGDALWSARALLDAPDLIAAIHRDYLEAGADCIASASYQATFEGFANAGIDARGTRELLRRSVELASIARGARDALVAACVGPYAGLLADGSEFTGRYDRDEDALHDWHAPRWRVLAAAGADLLVCETIPSFPEARALVRLLDATPDARAWLSFCCRDGAHLSDGTRFAHCIETFSSHPRIVALGVNCTPPRWIESLVRIARARTAKPIAVYPNSGETWDAAARRWIGERDPNDFAALARGWRAAGAAWIGGCCRTGPAHVRALAALREAT